MQEKNRVAEHDMGWCDDPLLQVLQNIELIVERFELPWNPLRHGVDSHALLGCVAGQ
jgi:hypothetical protein